MLWKKIDSQNTALKAGNSNIINADASIKKLLASAKKNKIFLQAFPLKPIASTQQIFFAFEQSFSALKQKTAFSQKPELEFLLRLSGKKQIKEIWQHFGLKKGRQEIVIVAAGKDKDKVKRALKEAEEILGFKESKNLLEKNLKRNFKFIQSVYSIEAGQLQAFKGAKEKALQQLVLEKMALLSVG